MPQKKRLHTLRNHSSHCFSSFKVHRTGSWWVSAHGFLAIYATQLTLYWLSTRTTVVSLGSNLKTCFRSAGPSTASSRAQSISSGSRTSRRPAGCSMVRGVPGWGALGSVDGVERHLGRQPDHRYELRGASRYTAGGAAAKPLTHICSCTNVCSIPNHRWALCSLKKPSGMPSCLPTEHWLGICTLCA